jgi:hypothetical protein
VLFAFDDDPSQQQAGTHHGHLDSSFAPEEHHRPTAGAEMVDYMLGQGHHHPASQQSQQQQVSLDKLSFSDVLQFADFGPTLALNNHPAAASGDDDDQDDEGYFFRFQSLPSLPATATLPRAQHHHAVDQEGSKTTAGGVTHDIGVSESTTLVQQPPDGGGGGRAEKQGAGDQGKSGRRKRPRTVKTSEEVESQRMTHIAVERNRRRQMNEYLRILRSLMPGSYVQRVRTFKGFRINQVYIFSVGTPMHASHVRCEFSIFCLLTDMHGP